MGFASRLGSILRNLLHKEQVESDLDAEIRAYTEAVTDEKIAAGMQASEARRTALAEIGGIESLKQSVRNHQAGTTIDALFQDLRFAVRTISKNYRFAIVVSLTLALGIGATTLVFDAIDSVLLHPFPYRNSARLATFYILWPNQIYMGRFPIAAYFDFKEQNHVFQDLLGLAFLPSVRYSGSNGTQQFLGGIVSPNAFEVLGVQPLLGRAITAADVEAQATPVFAMSYQLWVRQFNSDRQLIGRSFVLNGVARTLIAVMPPRFRFGECEVWMPISFTRDSLLPGYGLENNELWIVGHLRPGISVRTAQQDLTVIADRLQRRFPTYFHPQFKIVVHTLADADSGRFKVTLTILMLAAGILLLIACSNVAHLLLARATAREGELAMRMALGATRYRVIMQLIVESSVFTLASCIIGCGLAYMGLRLLRVVIPPDRVAQEVSFNLKPIALIFAMGITALVTGLCGLAPVIHSLGGHLRTRIDQTARTVAGIKYERLRSSLVIAEVALSTVLLLLAGLTLRSMSRLLHVDVGFKPDHLLFARFSVPPGRYNTAHQQGIFYRNMLDSVLKIPGVLAAAEATDPPPYTHGWTEIDIPGKTHAEAWGSTLVLCSEGYFNAVGQQLITGRFLSQDDVDSGRKVALVNQTLARSYFGSEDPVGMEIRFPPHETVPDWPRKTYFDIIGVVKDAKNHGLEDPARPEAYIPYTVTAAGPRGLLVKTTVQSDSILPAFHRAVTGVDRDVVVAEASSIATSLDQLYYAGPRFTFFALGTFACTGLLLAAVGVFGLIGYTVVLRRHEIAVRAALGAQRGDILIMILRKVLSLFAFGTVVGLVLAVWASRVLRNEVWGISASDPLTVVTVVVALATVVLVGSLLPVWRATHLNPMSTLHHE